MLDDALLEGDITWREEAACLTHPADLFFGLDDSEPPIDKRAREERAKLVCSGCLVKQKCLEYALSARESYGIWGGLTEVERKAHQRALKARRVVRA